MCFLVLRSLRFLLVFSGEEDFKRGRCFSNIYKIDSKVYDKYREFCKKKGLIVSRQFEIMMEEQLKKEGWKVLRFWEHEIKKNPERCIKKVKDVFNEN